jgi:hypothetical protein
MDRLVVQAVENARTPEMQPEAFSADGPGDLA